MDHRHLEPSGHGPDQLTLAELDSLLERGTMADWQPILTAIQQNPHGPLADRVLQVVRAHYLYGTSLLWERFILNQRGENRQRVG
jgi:hypothetical protein